MNPEPMLVTCARRYLEGGVGLPEVLDCAEKTGQSIEQHRQDTLRRLQAEPPHVQQMVEGEYRSWEDSCADFLHWARIATNPDGASEGLEKLCEGLPVTAQRLQFDIFRLEEALWVSRGPSTLASLNRVLAEMAHGENLEGRLQFEAEALRMTMLPLLEGYPEPLREPLSTSLEAILEWMESPSEGDQWPDQGVTLGKQFASHDLHFLARGYVAGPTAYPDLNLALNACWLQEQGLVAAGLSQYCLEQALEQLSQLPPPTDGDLPDVHDDLKQMLEQLLKQVQRGADTTALRTAATEVAQEMETALKEPPAEEATNPCPVCGQPQPLGLTRCGACGSKMLAHSEDGQPQDRLETMLAFAQELLSGQDSAVLRQGLDAYKDDLKKAQQHQDPAYQEILAEFQLGFAGMDEFLEAPDRALLDDIAQRLRAAQQRLKEWREKALAE